jgi:glycerol kinase
MEILRCQERAAADVIEKSGVQAQMVAAIGITNQRETTVIWDKRTGKPIYNAIVWQCRRTAGICEALIKDGLEAYVSEKTGLLIDAYFSASKVKWILDEVPGARQRAMNGELLFGTIDTWLVWNLTGGNEAAAHVIDYTNASRTMLFDIDKLAWDETLLKAFCIPPAMLPQPVPSSAVYGRVAPGVAGLEKLAGVPVAGAVGDQQAALFGQACFRPGDAKNTYGTGCFLVMNTGARSIRSRHRLLSTIAWGLAPGRAEYALEGSIFNAGSVIQWLRDDLGIIQSAPEINILAETVPDAGGVYLVPAFTGLGAPYWDMYARGAMLGITRGTTRAHLARAVLECIAYQVCDLVLAMQQDSGKRLQDLKVDGGASVSNVLMQFQADILGCRIHRPQNVETTAAGAAYLAGLAVGFWRDKEEISRNWKNERVFSCAMDEPTRNEAYRMWRRAVGRAQNWITP